MRGRLLLWIGVAAGLLLVWWLSGLGRDPADPARFFTREQIARANDYRLPRYWAVVAGIVLNLGALSLLAFTPAGDRLRRVVGGWPWPLAAAGMAILVVVLVALIRLPLSFWIGHLHERAWGFTTRSGGAWLADRAKGIAVAAGLAALVYTLLLAAIRWFPAAWPAVAGMALALFVVAASFLWPVVIEPIFNDFVPLRDTEQAASLRALADRSGVAVDEVLVADQSRRSTKENAYVSGFGETKRIVVYDTLLEAAPFEEVRLIVAHELGHRKLRHVEWGTALGALGAAAAVVGLWLLLRSPGVLAAARSAGPADPRIVPLLMLAVSVLTLVTAPPRNWVSRQWEEAADRFALAATADPGTFRGAQEGLALRNLGDLDPGPVAYRFLYTHPSPAERLTYADDT